MFLAHLSQHLASNSCYNIYIVCMYCYLMCVFDLCFQEDPPFLLDPPPKAVVKESLADPEYEEKRVSFITLLIHTVYV